MRIIVHGQQAFGKAVLEALLNRGDEIIAVYCAPEKEGQRADPLKEFAESRKLPVYQPKSFRKQEVWEEFASLKPDLCVMAYVTLFVPEEVLNIPTDGTIQYHPSLLPRHRGPSSINWPLIWGEEKTGLTIFWPDNGLDTGPILLQKEVPVKPDDTLGSLYFDHLFPMGVDAMLEAVDLVKAGKAPKVKQDEAQATYEGWCKKENVQIDWTKSADEVYNLIRGANPQPGAWTTFGGKTVQIFESRKVSGGGTPGEVTVVSGETFTVAAQGGQIEVQRVRPEGAPKQTAAEFASGAGIQAGTRLGG
ncbi:MAG TPA: methionyl-tRNA formyltransferase [bacterium]|nr:methionyl-tRNA formyltransferase [bacterium]